VEGRLRAACPGLRTIRSAPLPLDLTYTSHPVSPPRLFPSPHITAVVSEQ
jgi:hypothetical protein